MVGLAPSASAAQTHAAETEIETETLQRFLARNAGVAAGRLTETGEREMRAAFEKIVLVMDEGSLASTVRRFNYRLPAHCGCHENVLMASRIGEDWNSRDHRPTANVMATVSPLRWADGVSISLHDTQTSLTAGPGSCVVCR